MATWFRFSAVVAVAVMGVAVSLGCGDGDGTPTEATATATVAQATARATATSSIEEEVTDAYLQYWDAYSEALLQLDPDLVEGVATGEELARIREEIEGLRSQGLALRVVVEHNLVVVDASSDSATLFDEIVNNSFHVDAETKEPPQASGSGEILRDTFFLEKIDGTWMVVRSSRQR